MKELKIVDMNDISIDSRDVFCFWQNGKKQSSEFADSNASNGMILRIYESNKILVESQCFNLFAVLLSVRLLCVCNRKDER